MGNGKIPAATVHKKYRALEEEKLRKPSEHESHANYITEYIFRPIDTQPFMTKHIVPWKRSLAVLERPGPSSVKCAHSTTTEATNM